MAQRNKIRQRESSKICFKLPPRQQTNRFAAPGSFKNFSIYIAWHFCETSAVFNSKLMQLFHPLIKPSLLSLILAVAFSTAVTADNLLPVQLANPLQGTDSSWGFSHGNTYPAIALPFPMNTWAPYTQPQKDSFYYQYRNHEIRGIRQTHQPSAWIPEYGAFSLMPVSGKLAFAENDRVSTFDHTNEIAQPSYYKVKLDTWKAMAELTPTERGAVFRFSFEKPADAFVILDLFPSEKDSSVQIIASENKIIGIARNDRGAVPNNFGNYFVMQFDCRFSASGVWTNETALVGKTGISGNHVGAFVKFKPRKKNVIVCRVASSFISAGGC